MNLKVNYGLGEKCTIPISDGDNGGDCAYIWAGGKCEISIHSSLFYNKPTAALKKNKVFSQKESISGRYVDDDS